MICASVIVNKYNEYHSAVIFSIIIFSLCLMSSCGIRDGKWRNAQQVIDLINVNGSHLSISKNKLHDSKDDSIILDSIDFYTENTLGIDPSGFIIIFQEDKQAELFLHAGTFYNDDPDTSKRMSKNYFIIYGVLLVFSAYVE